MNCDDCDWKENRMHINETMKSLGERFDRFEARQEKRDEEIYKRLTLLQVAEGTLRVKSGMWGAAGSAIVGIGMLIWSMLK